MSAFICNLSHITALAVYAARNRILGFTDPGAVGLMLHAENVASVNHRYGESTLPRFRLCEWAAFHRFSRVQIVKAASCLDYQSCEHPRWPGSEACRLLKAIIGDDSARMAGWDEAEWEITPPGESSDAA